MSRDATYASTKARLKWERDGSPYCEHPSFYRDGNGYGRDDWDWYCGTCGAIRVGRDGDRPAPSGSRPTP